MVMRLTSVAFLDGEFIPQRHSYYGGNIRPALRIEKVPEAAKSLAFIMEDPMAPGGTWVHWIAWNVPLTGDIGEANLPKPAVEGINSWGEIGYGGPCPPSGTHRYYFKVYALDTLLNLPVDTDKEQLGMAMQGKVLEDAQLVGLYRS